MGPQAYGKLDWTVYSIVLESMFDTPNSEYSKYLKTMISTTSFRCCRHYNNFDRSFNHKKIIILKRLLLHSTVSFATCSTELSTQKTTILSPQRKKLIDVARGYNDDHEENDTHNNTFSKKEQQLVLRCFPLRETNFPSLTTSESLQTPSEFHQLLCQKIRSAQERIYIASLYIGPAAEKILIDEQSGINLTYPKELELLQALEEAAKKRVVDIKILLDHNRALRPVSIKNNRGTSNSRSLAITSASACYQCLHPKFMADNSSINRPSNSKTAAHKSISSAETGVYLISVLPDWLQQILPNPYNEVAGVFHIKCYIFDNDIILSGANLSEEYFTDRTDRYLWITDDAMIIEDQLHEADDNAIQADIDFCQNRFLRRHDVEKANDSINKVLNKNRNNNSGLVQCYADMIKSLCKHAELYIEEKTDKHSDTDGRQNLSSSSFTTTKSSNFKYSPRSSKNDLLKSLISTLTVPAHELDEEFYDDDSIIAYAIPTIQFPRSFLNELRKTSDSNTIPSDVDVICNLIRCNNILSHKTNDSSRTELSSVNQEQRHSQCTTGLRLATAYFNPTMSFLHAIKDITRIHFLSAGSLSHGFRPKKSSSKKSKTDFIPAMFDTMSRQAVSTIRLWKGLDASRNAIKQGASDDISSSNGDWLNSATQLWYYQRLDWTFHAKGIWLTQDEGKNSSRLDDTVILDKSLKIDNSASLKVKENTNTLSKENQSLFIHNSSTLCAVTNGSSNYGSRSDLYDMESNLVLIFPDYPTIRDQNEKRKEGKPIHKYHKKEKRLGREKSQRLQGNKCQELFSDEWNRICHYVEPYENEKGLSLSRVWKTVLPLVRPYF